MKYFKIYVVLFFLFFIIYFHVSGSTSSSADYRVPIDVFSAGGQEGTSTSYRLYDSVGQPATEDLGTSINYGHFTGFWYAVTESIPPCPQWSVPLTVQGSGGVSNIRIFGVHCDGTEGYDEGLDTLIPPPGFDFYSYFQGVAPFNYLSTDIQSSDSTLIQWNLVITNNDPESSFTVNWSLSDLPDSGYLTMADSIDMRVRNSVEFCCGNLTIPIVYGISPDFAIEVTPDTQFVEISATGEYKIFLGSIGGFDSPCTLSVSGLPPGAAASCDPEIIEPTDSSVLSIVTSESTPADTFVLTVTGRCGKLMHDKQVVLIVTPPCPKWSVPLTVQGSGGVSNIRIFGVHCDGTEGYDEGLDTLIPPPGFDFYSYFQGVAPFNYLSTDIQSSDSTLIQWNLVITNNDPESSFTVNWSLSDLPDSGYLTMADSIDMRVRNSVEFCCGNLTIPIVYGISPDFAIEVTPDTQFVEISATGEYKIFLGSIGGFDSPCTLSVSGLPPGAAASCDPEIIEPTDSSVLSIVTSESTPADTFVLTVTGRCGKLMHDKQVVLIVTPPCPKWSVPLTVQGSGGVSNIRIFGVHCDGTEGYDEGLDTLIPPPGFDFYSYFQGVAPFNYLSTDIQSSDSTLIQWNLVITNNDPESSFTVNWSLSDLPDSGCLTMADSVDMGSRSSVTFCCGNMTIPIQLHPCKDTVIIVTSPNGGEAWCVNDIQSICWESEFLDSLRIELSRDNGLNWDTLAVVAADDNCWNWTVTGPASNSCLVRISDASDGNPADTSDSVFAISICDGWILPLYVTCSSSVTDSLSYLGVSPNCSDSFDAACDVPEPPCPPTGDCVRLYFPHQEWQLPFDEFNSDIKTPFPCDSCEEWSFEVETNHSTNVERCWDTSHVPRDCDLTLIDSIGRVIDMKTTSCFSYNSVTGTDIRKFTISVGNCMNTFCAEYYAGWNLFSLPLEPVNTDPDSVIADDVLAYFLYGFDGCQVQYPVLEVHSYGAGYWLGLLSYDTICIEGRRCEPTQGPICIPIEACWNLIGCPFMTCVDWEKSEVCCNDDCVPLDTAVSKGWVFNILYGFSDGSYVISNTLCPGYAYWFAALVDGCELCLYPTSMTAGMLLSTFEVRRGFTQIGDESWLVELSAYLEDGTCDQISAFGVHRDASDGFDITHDLPRPPAFDSDKINTSYIRMYFPHREWSLLLGGDFSWDIKAPLKEGEQKVWNFEVVTSEKNGNIRLDWGELQKKIPIDYEIRLIDIDGGSVEYDMSTLSGISFSSTEPDTPYHFAITVIKPSSETATFPIEKYSLFQNYPNPFNPITAIHYQIPKDARVRLCIYNIQGQLVRTLVDLDQKAGSHTLHWDGNNERGERVSSGIYFCSMEVEDFKITKKMVLLR